MDQSTESSSRQESAFTALSLAFLYLKPALQGGKRALKAYQLSRAHFWTPPMWDQLKKAEQYKVREDHQKANQDALELEAQAIEDLEAEGAREDLKVAKRQLAKPAPEVHRSSWTVPHPSHQEVIADMKSMLIRPSLPRDLSTATESELSRLGTYMRVRNGRKAVRRAIRALGGQAG